MRVPVGDPAAGPPVAADPAHARRVVAVEKPDTGVADEDGYLYGYRLWQARLYPEAETQLKQVVSDYPKSKRASYAQNLLGRSYLDDGKSNSAATAFYESYKKFPDGERAPDSLYYLATTLMKLNKPADACKVYGELTDVYGTKVTPAMKADVAKGRVAAKCA
ncbi:tetratricopeptide repeat protein [Sphingomonas bacterium]|uniref:tetratricopeptide repeat protein n=1 Tax=Sphingomonas bacterium TaxID=1895847 RepID=UPI001576177E